MTPLLTIIFVFLSTVLLGVIGYYIDQNKKEKEFKLSNEYKELQDQMREFYSYYNFLTDFYRDSEFQIGKLTRAKEVWDKNNKGGKEIHMRIGGNRVTISFLKDELLKKSAGGYNFGEGLKYYKKYGGKIKSKYREDRLGEILSK